jgi:hypothetical protein
VAALAGKCQQILVAAILAFHAGKAVVQITAIKVAVDHLLDIGPPESVLPGEIFVIDPDKGFKIILYAAVVIRILRISWTINGGRSGHDLSPLRLSCRYNVERAFYLSRRKGNRKAMANVPVISMNCSDIVPKEITSVWPDRVCDWFRCDAGV